MIEKIKRKIFGIRKQNIYSVNEIEEELIRDIIILGHRIDKAITNQKINDKYSSYIEIFVEKIINLKNINPRNNLINWAEEIVKSFYSNSPLLVSNNKLLKSTESDKLKFYELSKDRISCRKWSEDQDNESLLLHARESIKCGIESPTSSNRQPWKFILFNNRELKIFKGLKEIHATNAPFGIFILMDTRVYMYDNRTDYSIEQVYLDAGATIMSMIYYLEINSFNTCWNHLGKDLINSREKNIEIYKNIIQEYNIESYMEPIALLVFGRGNDLINFKPPRQDLKYYLLGENNE